MNFEDFLKLTSKVKKIPLPAETSQFKMSPSFRLDLHEKYKKAIKSAKHSAVLALFYPDKNKQTKFALILRKTYSGVHSAQIGFPGGKVEDSDTNFEFTALRETYEEIGVLPEQVTIVKALTPLYIPPSNFNVQPFIGFTNKTPNFILQEEEVEALIEVSLNDFINDANVTSQKVTTSYSNNVEVPAFLLNGKIVWGATAMMLSEIKDLLKGMV